MAEQAFPSEGFGPKKPDYHALCEVVGAAVPATAVFVGSTLRFNNSVDQRVAEMGYTIDMHRAKEGVLDVKQTPHGYASVSQREAEQYVARTTVLGIGEVLGFTALAALVGFQAGKYIAGFFR